MEIENQCIPITATTSVPYFFGVWQPMGLETEIAFENLNEVAAPGDIFFAAEFDSQQRYHVNCWPEVTRAVQLGV